MSGQPTLFADDLGAPEREKAAAFNRYLRENPGVWRAFEAEALRVVAAGRTHHSARAILYWLRHETAVREKDGAFKINNVWSPWFARLFEQRYPEHRGLFTKRRAAADEAA